MFQWCYLLNASYRVGSHGSKAAFFTHYVGYLAKPTTGWPSEFWVPNLPKIRGVRLQSGMIIYTGLSILLFPSNTAAIAARYYG